MFNRNSITPQNKPEHPVNYLGIGSFNETSDYTTLRLPFLPTSPTDRQGMNRYAVHFLKHKITKGEHPDYLHAAGYKLPLSTSIDRITGDVALTIPLYKSSAPTCPDQRKEHGRPKKPEALPSFPKPKS